MTISKRNVFYVILALGMAVAFALAVIVQATSTIGLNVAAEDTRETADTGSYQSVSGDLTYEGAAGGTSFYHAGVMGNFMGDDLTNITSAAHAGVIGKYSVTTGDDLTGAKAGVVGELETDVGEAAVMAILGGDGGAVTPNAAYGVQYFNSTAASKFDYGLDLFHAATADYGAPSAVDYGTADIRLQNGETISNATDGTIDFGSALLTGTDDALDLSGSRLVIDSPGPTFDDSFGSAQTVAADANFDGYIGGSYGGAVMGNALGTIDASSESIIAGLIGKYNVDTNASDWPSAGVVGEVGEDSAGTADAAFLAVLGGDSGAVTAGAAYGVRYMNSNPGAEFDYGLDLSGASFGGYNAVTYDVADMRLSTGVTISSGAGAPTAACNQGSMYLRTDGAADSTIYACTAADTWTAMSNE